MNAALSQAVHLLLGTHRSKSGYYCCEKQTWKYVSCLPCYKQAKLTNTFKTINKHANMKP